MEANSFEVASFYVENKLQKMQGIIIPSSTSLSRIFNVNFMSTNIIYKNFSFSRVQENGKETVLQYENDILTSKTVNGVAQALKYS